MAPSQKVCFQQERSWPWQAARHKLGTARLGVVSKVSRREANTYISPLVEKLSCIPLQLLVPLVAHDGRAPPGEAFLGDVDVVPLHPLGPVAAVAAVDEARTLQEQGCSGHHRRLLQRGRSHHPHQRTATALRVPEAAGLWSTAGEACQEPQSLSAPSTRVPQLLS